MEGFDKCEDFVLADRNKGEHKSMSIPVVMNIPWYAYNNYNALYN